MRSEKARKTDRRSVYTRNVIKDSLLELLSAKDIADITISELCRAAEISRGTFYLHYNNTSEVLDELFNDALTSASSMLVQIGCEASSGSKGYPLCRFIRDNSKYQSLFFSDSLHSQVIERIAAFNMDSFLEHMRAATGLDDDVLITMFYFQLNGCLAVIKRNIRHHDGKWNDIQCTIDSFLKNGFDSLTK
jgi:AcrR family transcriptional regulator